MDYYAIGSPSPSRLFICITSEDGLPPNIVVETPHHRDREGQPLTVADFASFWAERFGSADDGAGGELLDDAAVVKIAGSHPDWFSAKDLVCILSAAEEMCGDSCDDEELIASRDDLRAFADVLACGKGG